MSNRRLPRRRRQRLIPERRRRPSRDKLTRERRRILVGAIEARIPIKRACELANIQYQTFRNWMKKGEDPTNGKFFKFRQRINQIEVQKEIDALKVIERAQKGGDKIHETKIVLGGKYRKIVTKVTKTIAPNWNAAAWWLERCRDGYAPRDVQQQEKTPQEAAQEIREALNAFDESVPFIEEEGE